jgi:hypothetical protein
VTSIGVVAFLGCTGLSGVTLPSSVASIGNGAFQDCSNLAGAYFQGNAPSSFGTAVFGGAAAGFTIYYPSGATGWTTPTWEGYPAQPCNSVLGLARGPGTVARLSQICAQRIGFLGKSTRHPPQVGHTSGTRSL